MRRRLGCTQSAVFKAKGALAAVRGDKTLSELAHQHAAHANHISDWMNQLVTRAVDVFSG